MAKPVKETVTRWRLLHDQWPSLTFYQRFESAIALALTLVIVVVIVVALYRLIAEVVGALARKFIVLDLSTSTPMELIALAAVTLAIGTTYGLMRERDDRVRRERGESFRSSADGHDAVTRCSRRLHARVAEAGLTRIDAPRRRA